MHTHRVALRQKGRGRDRKRNRRIKKYRRDERKRQTRRDRRARVRSTHINPPKLACARGKFCLALYYSFPFCTWFSGAPSIPLTHRHKLLLLTLMYNSNCCGNTQVGFNSPLHGSTPRLTCHTKIIAWMRGGTTWSWPKPVWRTSEITGDDHSTAIEVSSWKKIKLHTDWGVQIIS